MLPKWIETPSFPTNEELFSTLKDYDFHVEAPEVHSWTNDTYIEVINALRDVCKYSSGPYSLKGVNLLIESRNAVFKAIEVGRGLTVLKYLMEPKELTNIPDPSNLLNENTESPSISLFKPDSVIDANQKTALIIEPHKRSLIHKLKNYGFEEVNVYNWKNDNFVTIGVHLDKFISTRDTSVSSSCDGMPLLSTIEILNSKERLTLNELDRLALLSVIDAANKGLLPTFSVKAKDPLKPIEAVINTVLVDRGYHSLCSLKDLGFDVTEEDIANWSAGDWLEIQTQYACFINATSIGDLTGIKDVLGEKIKMANRRYRFAKTMKDVLNKKIEEIADRKETCSLLNDEENDLYDELISHKFDLKAKLVRFWKKSDWEDVRSIYVSFMGSLLNESLNEGDRKNLLIAIETANKKAELGSKLLEEINSANKNISNLIERYSPDISTTKTKALADTYPRRLSSEDSNVCASIKEQGFPIEESEIIYWSASEWLCVKDSFLLFYDSLEDPILNAVDGKALSASIIRARKNCVLRKIAAEEAKDNMSIDKHPTISDKISELDNRLSDIEKKSETLPAKVLQTKVIDNPVPTLEELQEIFTLPPTKVKAKKKAVPTTKPLKTMVHVEREKGVTTITSEKGIVHNITWNMSIVEKAKIINDMYLEGIVTLSTADNFCTPELSQQAVDLWKADYMDIPIVEKSSINDPRSFTLKRVPGKTEITSASGKLIFEFKGSDTTANKAARIESMYINGVIGLNTAQKYMITPELTLEDINLWKTTYLESHKKGKSDPELPSTVIKPEAATNQPTVKPVEDYYDIEELKLSKKSAKTLKEVNKINRLINNGNLKIEDLDKYAALGIISTLGVKAWRVDDQLINNYFYDEYDMNLEEDITSNLEAHLIASMDSDYSKYNSFEHKQPSKFQAEVGKASYRVIGKQVNNITRAAIINAIPEDKAESMKSFLASELGSSFVGMVGGITLTYAMENNPTAQKVAKELRIAGMATLGNELISGLVEKSIDLITTTVSNIEVEEVANLMEDDFIPENESMHQTI